MAKGFKHGGGGGSASAALNFKILGGTEQPSGASENTIWINTSEDISSWVLSPVEPEGVEGLVWILTGSVSEVAFNALKKNGIQVYPVSAKQYVDGAWVVVTAMTYQEGQWVEWLTYLLQDGAFEIAAAVYLHNTSTQSETQGDGYIEFSSTSSSGTDKTVVRGRMTEAAVDLTDIDTIYAKVNVTSAVNETNTAGATLAIHTGTTQSTRVAVKQVREIGEGLMTLDVSQYSGSYYIAFGAFAYRGNSGSPKGTVRFYDVYW